MTRQGAKGGYITLKRMNEKKFIPIKVVCYTHMQGRAPFKRMTLSGITSWLFWFEPAVEVEEDLSGRTPLHVANVISNLVKHIMEQ